MKNKKLPYLAYFSFCTLLLVLISATGGKTKEFASGGSASNGSGTNGHNGNSIAGVNHGGPGKSIFDQAGSGLPLIPDEGGDKPASKNDTDEPDVLDPADKDNPINPQTGRPYTNSTMKRFAKLRKKFPNNSILPHKRTPDFLARQRNDRMRKLMLQSLVAQGKASATEVSEFHALRSRQTRDRIEIVEYVMKQYKDKMSDEARTQYKKVLEMNRKSLSSLEKARDRALDKADN